MILVDTSVWINHLRKKDRQLQALLYSTQILVHPFIIGELACGNLKNRTLFLSLLKNIPMVTKARQEEVLFFIEENSFYGKGIGFIDCHLLAATALTPGVLLWSHDKRLHNLATKLCLAYVVPENE